MNTVSKNKPRVLFLDLTRGLAIFFMFAQHSVIIHEYDGGEGNNLFGNILLLLGTAPAAPVFMMIMGVFLMASRASVEKQIVRGFKLLFLGYLLNALRFSLPILIVQSEGIPSNSGESPLDMLLAVDILQLAGLSMIAGTVIKHFLPGKIVLPFLIALLLVASPSLWGGLSGNHPADLLWGNSTNVYFPFFPWFVYVMLGMFLSPYLVGGESFAKHMRLEVILGVIFFIAGILLYDFFPAGDYHRSGLAVHLLIFAFIFWWLPLLYWISQRTGEKNIVIRTLKFWSKNVTTIYFIQWVLFGWSMLIFDMNGQNAYVAALIGLGVLIITHLLARLKFIQNIFRFF